MINLISDHVYYLLPDAATDRPILGAIIGSKGTLLVDAGNSPAHARLFLDELAKIEAARPTYLALTHWHWDHVFGAATINLPTFASTETRRIVAALAQLDWSDEALDRRVKEGTETESCRDNIKAELPDRRDLVIQVPDIAFDSQVELDLGGITCQIVHVGGDHSPDCSVIYVQEEKILFMGDCLGEDYYSGPPSYTTLKLFPLIDRLLSFDADFFLEGHAPQPLSRQQMLDETNLLKIIGHEVDRTGLDRLSIITSLQERLRRPLDEDALEIVDSFLAGLRKSGSSRIIA